MKKLSNARGFTLIELLLVVVIIGLMLAIIVPRAWRANIDSKYGLVRQNCSELASWGQLWAEDQMEASVEYNSTCVIYNYLRSLCSSSTGATALSMWVANTNANNWRLPLTPMINIAGRVTGTGAIGPVESKVEDMVPPEKMPRNPFNGASVFSPANYPSGAIPIPGAIACGMDIDPSRLPANSWAYFAFVFQGTDSTSTTLSAADITTFHAGMQSREITGLRNGIFFARAGILDTPTTPVTAP